MLGTQEELSIFGGPPVVGEGAVQPWPQVATADKAAVMGVLERGVLWGGGGRQRRKRWRCRRNGRHTWARVIAW